MEGFYDASQFSNLFSAADTLDYISWHYSHDRRYGLCRRKMKGQLNRERPFFERWADRLFIVRHDEVNQ